MFWGSKCSQPNEGDDEFVLVIKTKEVVSQFSSCFGDRVSVNWPKRETLQLGCRGWWPINLLWGGLIVK